jgi:hypothetical protein
MIRTGNGEYGTISRIMDVNFGKMESGVLSVCVFDGIICG